MNGEDITVFHYQVFLIELEKLGFNITLRNLFGDFTNDCVKWFWNEFDNEELVNAITKITGVPEFEKVYLEIVW